MENFKQWLQKEESLDEGISKWAAPLVMAGSSLLGTTGHYPQTPPVKAVQSQIQDRQINLNKIANAVNQKFNLNISPHEIEMIRPVDVIKPMYNNKWQQVYDKAQKAQTSQQIGGMEVPAINSYAVTDTSKLNTPVPVIYDDPTKFGKSEDVGGFCLDMVVDNKLQKVCVVKDRSSLHTLRHELSHATQDVLNPSLGGEGQFGEYFMTEKELGVRLAELKRNYYQLTGKIITSDRQSISDALKHFLNNPTKYSNDVQQLKYVIEKSSEQGLLPKLINFFKDNIDKVVINTPQQNYA